MVTIIATEIQSKLIKEFVFHSFNDKPAANEPNILAWYKHGMESRENGKYSCFGLLSKTYDKGYYFENKYFKTTEIGSLSSSILKEFNDIKGI